MNKVVPAIGVILLVGALYGLRQQNSQQPLSPPFEPVVPQPEPDKPNPPGPRPHPTPEPEEVPTGIIKVKTADEFSDLIKKNRKSRAVFLTGDWCWACKLLKKNGIHKQIERNFPNMLIVEFDPVDRGMTPILQGLVDKQDDGTIKGFSSKSTLRAYPSFLVKNVVLTGNEITSENVRKIVNGEN